MLIKYVLNFGIPNVMMRLLNLGHLNIQKLHKTLMQLNFMLLY